MKNTAWRKLIMHEINTEDTTPLKENCSTISHLFFMRTPVIFNIPKLANL